MVREPTHRCVAPLLVLSAVLLLASPAPQGSPAHGAPPCTPMPCGGGGDGGGRPPWADIGKDAWLSGGGNVDEAARASTLPTLRELRLVREDFLTRPSSSADAESLKTMVDSLLATVPNGADTGLDLWVLAEAEACATSLNVMGYTPLAGSLLDAVAARYTSLSGTFGGHPVLDELAAGAAAKAAELSP